MCGALRIKYVLPHPVVLLFPWPRWSPPDVNVETNNAVVIDTIIDGACLGWGWECCASPLPFCAQGVRAGTLDFPRPPTPLRGLCCWLLPCTASLVGVSCQ